MASNTLKPIERAALTLRGERPDKLALFVSNCNTFLCRYYGMTAEDYVHNAELTARLTVRFWREFGFDYGITGAAYILYGCGPELGPRWEFAGEEFPGCVSGVVNGPEDLDRLEAPETPSGYFKSYLDILARTVDLVGEEIMTKANVLGPFSTACFMRGLEQVLLDTRLEFDLYQAYMERCVRLSEYFGRHVIATGVKKPSLNEVFVNPTTVSPAFYHRHVAPYDRLALEALGPDRVASPRAAAVMGRPDDAASQKASLSAFQTQYGTGESLEVVKHALRHAAPGSTIPLTISGRALSAWSIDRMLTFLREGLDYLVREMGIYPPISIASVQAESTSRAVEIAAKLMAVAEFRDGYRV